MKKIYAPWRKEYVTDAEKVKKKQEQGAESVVVPCVFCQAFSRTTDEQDFILERREHTIVMLNRYPYNAGHLLILPIAHTQTLVMLPPVVRTELMETTSWWTGHLERTLRTDGLNVGINIGEAGGGGIPQHLHVHVLPRWKNDTSFLPLLAETKVISVDMQQIYTRLRLR